MREPGYDLLETTKAILGIEGPTRPIGRQDLVAQYGARHADYIRRHGLLDGLKGAKSSSWGGLLQDIESGPKVRQRRGPSAEVTKQFNDIPRRRPQSAHPVLRSRRQCRPLRRRAWEDRSGTPTGEDDPCGSDCPRKVFVVLDQKEPIPRELDRKIRRPRTATLLHRDSNGNVQPRKERDSRPQSASAIHSKITVVPSQRGDHKSRPASVPSQQSRRAEAARQRREVLQQEKERRTLLVIGHHSNMQRARMEAEAREARLKDLMVMLALGNSLKVLRGFLRMKDVIRTMLRARNKAVSLLQSAWRRRQLASLTVPAPVLRAHEQSLAQFPEALAAFRQKRMDRAADCLREFCSHLSASLHYKGRINKFRSLVVRAQGYVRSFLVCKAARLEMLRLLWCQQEKLIIVENYKVVRSTGRNTGGPVLGLAMARITARALAAKARQQLQESKKSKGDSIAMAALEEMDNVPQSVLDLQQGSERQATLTDKAVRESYIQKLLATCRRQHIQKDWFQYRLNVSRPPMVSVDDVRRMMHCQTKEMASFSDPLYRGVRRCRRFSPFLMHLVPFCAEKSREAILSEMDESSVRPRARSSELAGQRKPSTIARRRATSSMRVLQAPVPS